MTETVCLDLNIRCPKCADHSRLYSAPLGKIVRNPFAAPGGTPVHDDCNACNGTGYVPSVVTQAIRGFARGDNADKYLANLRWSGDHFSFDAHGMYVGVERDGYLHT